MARFPVIHGTPPQATQEQLFASAKGLAASLPPKIQWLNSWAVPKVMKLFCEWEAPNAEALRAALEPVQDLFPTEVLYKVEWINPKWYR